MVVDIFDSKTQKLIWRAKQSDALSGNPDMNEKLTKDLAVRFKPFLRHAENEENYMELEDSLPMSPFNHPRSSGS